MAPLFWKAIFFVYTVMAPHLGVAPTFQVNARPLLDHTVFFNNTFNADIIVNDIHPWTEERGGTGCTCPPPFNVLGKCPFSYNLVALLETFEDAKLNRKIHVSGDFRRSKFQNFPGSRPPDPLVALQLGTVPILTF